MTQTTDRCTECHEYIGDHKLSGDRCPPLDLAVVAITLTKQAVNCGDHAQDITSAVAARPDETVEHLIRRTLITRGWNSKPEPHGDYYLTIRIADEESR